MGLAVKPLDVSNAVKEKSEWDWEVPSMFISSQINKTCNSSIVMRLERVQIEVLNGPNSEGKPFKVWMRRSSSSTGHKAATRLSERCLNFWMYSVIVSEPFLMDCNWVFNCMMWDLEREAKRRSKATQTSRKVDGPTTWARTPSDKVALIQHKTFWSC